MRRNGFNGVPRSDPEAPRHHRVPRRDPLPRRLANRTGRSSDVVIGNPPFLGGKLLNAGSGRGRTFRSIFGVYAGPRPRGGRSRLLLVRQGRGAQMARGQVPETRGPGRDELHPGRREPPCVSQAAIQGPANLRGVERRAVGDRRRGGAGVAGVLLATSDDTPCFGANASMVSPLTRYTPI